MGIPKDEVGTYVSIVMVFIGAFLTGIGVYDKIAKFAGAGTVVPITGFANSIVSPAMEFKQEGYVFGVAAKNVCYSWTSFSLWYRLFSYSRNNILYNE
ncbi:stage V sporulation protein AC (SpoVAC) [Clostridium botulinum H04402 065]|nr:stage V sporulation protein AC (SpoVAC) [Clostridium botulinum H04402 065]